MTPSPFDRVPPLVIGWMAMMAGLVVAGMWWAIANWNEPSPKPPPPWPANIPLPNVEPYRAVEPTPPAMPDPNFKHDVLFNNGEF